MTKEKANSYSRSETDDLLITVSFNAPSTSETIVVDFAKLGIPTDKMPKGKKSIAPRKIHESIVDEFKSIQRKGYNELRKNSLSWNGLWVIAPWRLQKVEQIMNELEWRWLKHLAAIEPMFDQLQEEVMDEIRNDENIVDWEYRKKYITYVESKMPVKERFIRRHRMFKWGVVPIFSGNFNREGYFDALNGLDNIREGVAGEMIAEVTATSTSLMEKIQNGKVQANTQQVFRDLVEKLSDYSFINDRFGYLARVTKAITSLFPSTGPLSDKSVLSQISDKLKPLTDQFMVDDVVFQGYDLYETGIESKSKAAASQTASAIVELERKRLEEKAAQRKERGKAQLDDARALVNPEFAEQLKEERCTDSEASSPELSQPEQEATGEGSVDEEKGQLSLDCMMGFPGE